MAGIDGVKAPKTHELYQGLTVGVDIPMVPGEEHRPIGQGISGEQDPVFVVQQADAAGGMARSLDDLKHTLPQIKGGKPCNGVEVAPEIRAEASNGLELCRVGVDIRKEIVIGGMVTISVGVEHHQRKLGDAPYAL